MAPPSSVNAADLSNKLRAAAWGSVEADEACNVCDAVVGLAREPE